jgi:hypothetical protein
MSNIPIEIICMDDCSRKKVKEENDPLHHKFMVNYIELSNNIGRAKIRNWLSKLARYDHLLFIDCDSAIDHDDFLDNYIKNISNADVIYGGRLYDIKPSRSLKRRLHWKYGKEIESNAAERRNKNPYLSFMSNNFLIHQRIFQKFKFDENIEGYGYEDLAYSHVLQKNKIPVLHIDNPVIHKGLETTEELLKKTVQATENLYRLYESQNIGKTRLIRTAERLEKLAVDKISFNLLSRYEAKIIDKLHGKDPNLTYFSLFKLLNFLRIKYKKKGL